MKKAVFSILAAILLISTFSTLAAMIAPAKAAYVGVFEVSSTWFSGDAIIQMRLFDPDLNLDPAKRDSAYVTYTKGTNTTALWLNETLPNSGEFIGYIRNASSTQTPANPPYDQSYRISNLILSPGDTFTLTYNDASPVGTTTITVTYKSYSATSGDISLDRASLEYPMNGYINVTIKDFDLNKDPTNVDSATLSLTLYNAVNGNTTTLTGLSFTETGVNTAMFTCAFSYYTSINFKGYNYNLSALLNVSVPIKISYELGYKYITFKTFPVTLEVASTFTTSGDLLIKVTDPNLEHKSWKVEYLGSIGNTNVTIKMGNDTVCVTGATALRETGAATATFTAIVPVKIGTVNTADDILQYNLTSKVASITYYGNGTKLAETVSTLSTTPATLTTDKTMYKATDMVTLNLTAPDLNDDSLNINYFTVTLLTTNQLIENVQVLVGGVNVGNLTIKVNGLVANSSASQTLTFIETGANTGIFTASLNLTKIRSRTGAALKNGDSLQIVYTDRINVAVTTASFTIGVAAATIDIDRTTYPVRKEGNVIIHITVTSSEDNTSPTTIQTKDAYVDVYYYNGTRKASEKVPLTETGANTGIFTGYYRLAQSNDQYFINGWGTVRTVYPATEWKGS